MNVRSVLTASIAIVVGVVLIAPTAAVALPARDTAVSVTIFLRHGIRAPLSGELPNSNQSGLWPTWPVAAGLLTPRGSRNVKSLGLWLGRDWRRRGLLPAGCPTASDLSVRSNSVHRTIDSARALVAGLVSDTCKIAIEHMPEGSPDPIFDPQGAGAVNVDAQSLSENVPPDSTAIWLAYAAPIARLQTILGCRELDPNCGMNLLPSHPIAVDRKGVHLDPRSRGYAGAAQGLLLQYAEGLRMPRVRGRSVGAADVMYLSRLHAVSFIYEAREPQMADQLSKPFFGELEKQVAEGSQVARIRIFVGHDNVLSAITARLGIDFTAPGYGLDDPPIGGGFGFELIRTGNGEKRVRGFYIAQTPDQLRQLSALRGSDGPWRRYFAFGGCSAPASLGCPVSTFRGLLREVRSSLPGDLPA